MVYAASYSERTESKACGSFLKTSEYLVKSDTFLEETVQKAELYRTQSDHSCLVQVDGIGFGDFSCV